MIGILHPTYNNIIYLEGEVEVEASGGEKRIFKVGDVLFATDLSGEGHVTRTLSKGRSIIVKEEIKRDDITRRISYRRS